MASSVDVPATIQEDDEVVAKSFLALSFISREREKENEHTDNVSRKFLAKWNKPLLHI
ncbi:unnamed protein product [Brassica oleracea var. botrytis]